MSRPKRASSSIGARRKTRLSTLGSKYTWFVRVSKVMLPLVALSLVALVIVRLSQDGQQVQLADVSKPSDKTTAGQSLLVKPRYEGKDSQGRPYTVTADHAARDMSADQAVVLDNPVADMSLEDGTWVAVKSTTGKYDHPKSDLLLTGGVVVYHDSGYEMHLQDADINIAGRHAISQHPVQGQGPQASIVAQGLEVQEQGDLIVFTGPATLTLHNLHGNKKGRG